ncbi:MAG: hypothetical protein NXH75_16415, partial [Halobacteriovoraceae bacterium]|nr:hypothetical protein [Halobacteriovoraceae bacterium]
MKNTLFIVISLLMSFSAQAGCGFNYESDVAQFFATMGDSYHCNMVEVNRVNKEVVLKCDHVLGSSYVKDLKVSQEF